MATVGSMAIVLTASATDFERTMGRAARSVKSTEREFMQSARRMQDIGRKWTLGVTTPIVAGLTAVSRAAIAWEDDFAGVRKSVTGTEEQLADLDRSLRKMTETIPVAHKELAGIAEGAGQLGIRIENIEDFTRTMAMIGSTTKMSADEAATGLAQIDNIMQTGQKSFDRYGSTALALGNNLATTEQKIVDFTLKIAGAGRIAGLAEAQVMAIGGAFGSVGVEAQAGGTAVSKVLMGMTEAVATGNKSLKWFAATAGMSSAEFAAAWREDAGEAFTRFVEGLGKSGDKAFGILRELGLADQRLIRGFLSVAGAGDLLRKSMNTGTKAWEENVYLAQKAEERYRTAGNRLKKLGARFKNVAITTGGAFAPLLDMIAEKGEKVSEGLQRMADSFAALPKPVRTAVGNLLLLLAAVGPAIYAFGLLNRTIAGVIGAGTILAAFAGKAAFAFTAWRMGAATLGESLVYLVGGPVKLAILGIGAAIVAAVLLAANWEKVAAFARAAWGVVSAVVLYSASLIVRGIGLIISAIGAIVPAVRGAGQAMLGLADSLKASASQSMASARSAASVAAQAAESQKAIADAGNAAANTQDGLAESIEGVGKAAQANLQSFDEVHQMQDSMADSAPDLEGMVIPEIKVPEIPAVGIASMGEQFASIAETAASAWDRLRQAMDPINRAIQWIKDNWPAIGPIIETIASIIMALLIPALVKSGAEALISAGKHVAAWAIKGIAAITQGAIIIGQLALVIAKWAWAGIEALVHAGKIVLAWAMQGWEAVASVAVQIGQFILAGAKWLWLGVQAGIGTAQVVAAWVVQKAQTIGAVAVQVAQFIILGAKWVWMGVTAMANAAVMAAAWIVALGPVVWITAAVIALAVLIIANWDWIKEKTIEIWGAVSAWLSDKWEWLKGVAGTAWGWITDNIVSHVQTAWSWLKDTWGKIAGFLGETWDGIKKTAGDIWKGVANTVIGFINKIVDGLNEMVKGMNKLSWEVPSWVPIIGGKSFGFNLKTIGKIPMLGEGAIVTAPTFAMVGERGPEAVLPLSGSGGGFVGAVAEAVERGSYAGTVQGIRVASVGNQGQGQQEVVLRIDGATFARLILPAIIKEGQRQGMDLVVRPQGV